MMRLLCLLPFLAFAMPLSAADGGSPIRFDHMALSVTDADRSAAFYMEVFGLEEIVNRTEIEGIRWFSLGEGKELHLISIDPQPIRLSKDVHFALTMTDFDGFVSELRETGREFSDFAGQSGAISTRSDGIRQIYLQDPDGYWIEVNSTASD
jgi:lactoylglutathione lyase